MKFEEKQNLVWYGFATIAYSQLDSFSYSKYKYFYGNAF